MKNYANQYSYTDVNPFEVVSVISEQSIDIREMESERDKEWRGTFHVGGFSANCSNQDTQRWNITSNELNPLIRIRFSKSKQRWQDKYGNRYKLEDNARRFYDYNF